MTNHPDVELFLRLAPSSRETFQNRAVEYATLYLALVSMVKYTRRNFFVLDIAWRGSITSTYDL